MKIFITGGSGLIGQYLNVELSKEHEILTQHYNNIGNCENYNSVNCSITDYQNISDVLNSFKPDVVIHTAAISNSEKADALPADFVYDVNVNATKHIAELCQKINAKMIYTSTDLVYAGYRGSYLTEEAKLVPISLYAETKLMGEVKIQQTFDNYIILRQALVIGFGLNGSRNNFHSVYENLKSSNPVKLFVDQFRSPIALKDNARLLSELIKLDVKNEVINWCGSVRLSRYEIGERLCEAAGFDKELLIKIKMEEARINYPVAEVSMNNSKMVSLGLIPKDIDESIREMFSDD